MLEIENKLKTGMLVFTLIVCLIMFVTARYLTTWIDPTNQVGAISCAFWLLFINVFILYIVPDKKAKPPSMDQQG